MYTARLCIRNSHRKCLHRRDEGGSDSSPAFQMNSDFIPHLTRYCHSNFANYLWVQDTMNLNEQMCQLEHSRLIALPVIAAILLKFPLFTQMVHKGNDRANVMFYLEMITLCFYLNKKQLQTSTFFIGASLPLILMDS